MVFSQQAIDWPTLQCQVFLRSQLKPLFTGRSPAWDYSCILVCMCVRVHMCMAIDGHIKYKKHGTSIYFQIQQTNSKPGKHWTGNSKLVTYFTTHSRDSNYMCIPSMLKMH